VFVAGEAIEACYEQLMNKWFGSPLRLHIDSWMELRIVDGQRIRLRPEAAATDRKLYFINLGAYLPGQFTELHANTFVVAASEAEVKERAKSELLRARNKSTRMTFMTLMIALRSLKWTACTSTWNPRQKN